MPATADITFIGGGPTGLFGLFYAGMRGVDARVIDALPELGGQLRALYPEKYIYDVAGFPKVRAKVLCDRLVEQALQFDPDVRLDECAERLERKEDHFVVETDRGEYPTRTVIIAGGKGAFEPRRLDVPGFDRFWKNGVWPHVKDPEAFRDRRVLIVGGGDSAFDWSLALSDVAAELVQIHRSDRFRAHERTVEQVEAAAEEGKLELLTHHEVREIHGADAALAAAVHGGAAAAATGNGDAVAVASSNGDGSGAAASGMGVEANGSGVEAVTIYDNRTDEERRIELDAVLSLIGFKPDIGPLAEWGFDIDGRTITVDSRMMTDMPGVYAAGDIAHHDGKLELLATGFGEVAVAVNNAVHHADPDARVNPGHSTSLKVFKDD